MLGQGLEALIPPQKGQASSVPQHTDPEPMAAPREEPLEAPQSHVPMMLHLHDDDEPQATVEENPRRFSVSLEPDLSAGAFVAPPIIEEPEIVDIEASDPIQKPVSDYQEPVREVVEEPVIQERVQPTIPSFVQEETHRELLVKKPPHRELQQSIFHIETDKIVPNPHQPRKEFDQESLQELAASIREFGILQPLVVNKINEDTPYGTKVVYQLIAGERRLRASKLLGLPRVPVMIRQAESNKEQLELAIIENLQREELNPIEMARAYARLQDEFGMTQREVASRLGKSRATVANTLRLLDLTGEIQDAISDGRISESHGRLLLGVQEQQLQHSLFQDLLSRNMTTRELRDKVQIAKPQNRKVRNIAASPQQLSPELMAFQERLSSELGAPVNIQSSGERGKITISFYSKEELSAILERLAKENDILL